MKMTKKRANNIATGIVFHALSHSYWYLWEGEPTKDLTIEEQKIVAEEMDKIMSAYKKRLLKKLEKYEEEA